ncbi:MAG: (deoxy)nucleoside triphosphate pyrophosphohydrolase [Clostridiales bacterium]|nr:(deoxy)nucleoside triphosphate pyrophosphohydrolase [Clostridiales bacterium]
MIAVVAGIIEQHGRILLAQRKAAGRLPLKWEFPGGKLEPGESPEQALERELDEELGVKARAGRVYDVKLNESGDILLLFYFVTIVEGAPEPLDANALAWATPETLASYDLAPTDRIVAQRLAEETGR